MPATVTESTGDYDRLGFTLCLALAVHALVVFGIGFTRPVPVPQPARLEVTLAKHHSDRRPEKADFIAASHQQASGTEAAAVNPSSPHQSPMDDTGIRATLEVLPQAASQMPDRSLVTAARSTRRLKADRLIELIAERETSEQIAILERNLEIASLEARFDVERRQLAKNPRVRRLTSVSAQAAEDAEYLLYWQNRIERIGNLNYPAISRQRKLYGSLTMVVRIGADGQLQEASISHGSGHAVLDEAALRIVGMAAPFQAFPDSLRRQVDALEIVRTWHFRRDRLTARD